MSWCSSDPARVAAILAILVLTGGAGAEEPRSREEPEPPPIAGEEAPSSVAPADAEAVPPQTPGPRLYVPPDRGAARSRIGAATRGESARPQILALAPDHVGLTAAAAPVLFFHLDAPSTAEVDIVVADPSSGLSLLETTLKPPLAEGVHALPLSDYGVEIPVGRTLRWFAALVPDRADRTRDRVAGAAIRRENPSRGLRRSLEGASPVEAGRAYARHGYWYDAFAAFSDPASAALRDQLLDEVGLPEARSTGRP